MCELEITYDGAYNVVVECIDCGTERGSSVVANTKLRPGRTFYEHCEECGGYREHEPVREAERGEYDGHLICDDCDEQFGNTMDVDLHDCPAESDDEGGSEDGDLVADGGEDMAAHVDDATIVDVIDQHDDTGHEDALTVADVRELLAHVQYDAEMVWGEWCDNIERDDSRVVAQDGGLVVLDTGEHDTVRRALETYTGSVTVDEIAERIVSTVHHRVAEQIAPDYNWGVAYPRVVRLPADGKAGQEFVEATINNLMRRDLSPGQAWAYYGVEIRGNSRNQWATRCGYSDHSAVSDPVRKANQKF